MVEVPGTVTLGTNNPSLPTGQGYSPRHRPERVNLDSERTARALKLARRTQPRARGRAAGLLDLTTRQVAAMLQGVTPQQALDAAHEAGRTGRVFYYGSH
jgi:hypothetical protein